MQTRQWPSGTRVRPGRVLVVGDEPLPGEPLRAALCRENEVVLVTRASEALARLVASERYDVVLCDLMMPGMDGIEFHRQLRAALPDEARRVVFVTGGAVTARVESFFLSVSNLLLDHPIDVEGLCALIQRRVRGDEEGPAQHCA